MKGIEPLANKPQFVTLPTELHSLNKIISKLTHRSMVGHTAHNGQNVGSNPAGLKLK